MLELQLSEYAYLLPIDLPLIQLVFLLGCEA
jgi:hypothetical protein